MKIEFETELLDLEGKPILEANGTCPHCGQEVGTGKALTAKSVLTRIAAMPLQADPDGKKAIAAFTAGLKVAQNEEITTEEASLLKERLFASGYNNVIKGRIALLLN